MATPKVPAAEREAQAVLADRGLRVTRQRTAILAALLRTKRACSHGELAALLAPAGLDRVTVYRTLLSLTEAGVLVKTQLGDAVWRFDVKHGASAGKPHTAHPHFVCNSCGDVACLPADAVAVAVKARAGRRRVAEIQLRGTCGDCG
jgi:Fur family ferric uptake transcriptional regulator